MSVPATRSQLDRKLISEVAMDIGKELVAYIERQYPAVFEQMNGGARLSFRNHIHNDIMAALDTTDADEIRERLVRRRKERRDLLRMTRVTRRGNKAEIVRELTRQRKGRWRRARRAGEAAGL